MKKLAVLAVALVVALAAVIAYYSYQTWERMDTLVQIGNIHTRQLTELVGLVTPTTAPLPTTTTAPPEIVDSEVSETRVYVLRVSLRNSYGSEISESLCRSKTAPGEPFDNVPSATYSLVDQTNNIIGVLFPKEDAVGSCTFEYEGEFESLPDLLLIRGPRMQQNGFPVRAEDFVEDLVPDDATDVPGSSRVIIADLRLTVS